MTVSAPNLKLISNYNGKISIKDINLTLEYRIKQTLRAFSKNNFEHLVLGAFGCGVFGNNPHDVAKVFKKQFIKNGEFYNTFKTVTFSIIKDDRNNNFEAFNYQF